MNEEKLNELIRQDLEWIDMQDGAYGLWISSLWPFRLKISFLEKKEVFFFLLMRLLQDGKAYLAEPADAKFGERRILNANVWAAPHDHMIEYMKYHWPPEASCEHDASLHDFWYDIHCPRLLWLDTINREIFGS